MSPQTEVHQAVQNLELWRPSPELHLEYQPIVRPDCMQPSSVEALIRWTAGGLSPLRLIGWLEKSGAIHTLGRWVLAQSCLQWAAWHRQHPTLAPRRINVNVSPLQLRSPTFVGEVAEILSRSGMNAQHLCLELTETQQLGDRPDALARLCEFRSWGIHISLDDFGSGYSSIPYLSQVPATGLKIDRSFLAGFPQPLGRRVLLALIGLGRSMGMETTAEGVERENEAAFLSENGCDLLQGWWVSRPLSAVAMGNWLQSRSLSTFQ